MARKLKPGGQIVIQVPNYGADYRKMSGRSWVWLIPPVHLQYFTDRSLAMAIRQAGLTPTTLDSWYNGTYVYLLTHHITHALGLKMPSTRRTGRPVVLAAVNAVEWLLRTAAAPWAAYARRRMRHNELDFIAKQTAS
jgi:hypothetical protein